MTVGPDVAVVDYGAGNLRSVVKALERSGARARVTREPSELRRADAVVLPGAGAFADAMAGLRAKGLDGAVRETVAAGTPYLGLCVGLQLLFEEGDEHGPTAGLGLLRGRVERFPERDAAGGLLRVPHMGWNEVHFTGCHPVLEGLPERDIFYFVHGYRAVPARDDDTVGHTGYGGEFAAAVARDNVFAVQFHPEKSQNSGRRLLNRFVTWVGSCD
ncbi:MAG: imidazole glycerol phosphate synthase subunit HisH [Myxococcota bacterium]|mgnify:CR=1 FL=1|jgi:glutamine amidotransferase|nr:imidazole glycerol phosphate synthase subunit HisH [Deltaproteobacteria bacterium]MCP4245048.1 imidazole glycerol phosphate synthase subunit HisH [bacterium]MDP6074067.1 imidazole glycerol phosphate synthase subunit HisH [Myxococcota bacterium]MDP6242374.1 imidazole glycerol phosphate synthase subunit HisH [Myxococcota bacterium]MDP7075153.1 imidazole glycerol phosphate synthase subunit HisH [Myxococcota bacterium]